MSFGARAHIRLGAIRHNLQHIRQRAAGAKIMAVVKANAYGHGLVPVAMTLADADCLAVARLHEAIELRTAGIASPIALLGGVLSADDLDRALDLDLQLGVHNEAQIEWLERRREGGAVVWLKIDTGMNRLGFGAAESRGLIEKLAACPAVGALRIMTHFANADDVKDPQTGIQIAAFRKYVSEFRGDVSVANSPALFGWRDAIADFAAERSVGDVWIRPGLSLYGVAPFAGRRGADLGLQPAMEFASTLIAVKPLQAGAPVGYGGTWQSPVDTVLGIIAAGYGDGYSRFIPPGTPVIVNGRRVTVAGRVSMDLTAVNLGPDASDRVGDPVVLWGDDLPVEEIADCAGTIPYELLCGITHREPPVYAE